MAAKLFGDEGVKALAATCPRLFGGEGLRVLFGDEGVEALAASCPRVFAKGVKALAASCPRGSATRASRRWRQSCLASKASRR